jgi:hypothetical protein
MSEIITGISGIKGELGDITEPINKNNGLIPDIYQHNGNVDHIMVNNDIQLDEGKSMNCSEDILSGVLEETLLSKYFFSDDNVMNIQKLLRYEFFKEKNVTIDTQSNITLLTIMRGIYLKYSNSADNTLDRIKLQIQKLNDMVVQYSLSKMYSNYDMHVHYLDEINSLPSVMPLPQPNNRTNYTYDPSERNDMSGQEMSGQESKYFDLFSS